jgi:hypothetical protein
VTQASPIWMLFDEPIADVGSMLESYLASNGLNFASASAGVANGGINIALGAVSPVVTLVKPVSEIADYKKIFTNYDARQAQSAIALDLGPAVAGGNRVPPIAQALLTITASFAGRLGVRAIAIRPAKLLCDTAYFDEAVQAYAGGAAFPVLATIGFSPSADGKIIRTQGLDWFAGQEIEFDGDGMSQTDMMQRLVRVVHDICTNGPILQPQMLTDLDPNNRLALEPNSDGGKLVVSIRIGLSSTLA